MKKEEITLICHRIEQPIGAFFQTCINWKTLIQMIKIQYRILIDIDEHGHEIYRESVQRKPSDKRKKEIKEYILQDSNATFPTSIIINISHPDSVTIEPLKITNHQELYLMKIKMMEGIAQVIDGQHRLSGFEDIASDLVFDLPVSIFIDTTLETQAEIFSIINGKQTRVSTSLVYDLFGLSPFRTPYRVSNEIIKMLNESSDSPLKRWIKILGKNNDIYKGVITQSTMAKYIIKFICGTIVQADEDKRNIISGKKIQPLSDKKILFRTFFINNDDVLIYKSFENYFNAVKKVFDQEWANESSIFRKTVGFCALLEVFEELSFIGIKDKDLSKEFYVEKIKKVKETIDFTGIQLSSKGVKQLKARFNKAWIDPSL